jgi:hypothetical protein
MTRLIAMLALFAAALQPAVPAPALAPGAPGARATWTNGNKQGIGTALEPRSKVWFTLGDGVLTEVYYPTVDRANLRLMEFMVTDGAGFFERESVDTDHRVDVLSRDVLSFRQTNSSRSEARSSCTFTSTLRSTTAASTIPPTSRVTCCWRRRGTSRWLSRARPDSAQNRAGSWTRTMASRTSGREAR